MLLKGSSVNKIDTVSPLKALVLVHQQIYQKKVKKLSDFLGERLGETIE